MPQLRYVLLGFVAGLHAVGPIMLLMLLVIYLYAVVGRVCFGGNDPAHFGDIPTAMLSLFQFATLSGWGDIYAVNAHGCDKFDLYGDYQVVVVASRRNPYLSYSLVFVVAFVSSYISPPAQRVCWRHTPSAAAKRRDHNNTTKPAGNAEQCQRVGVSYPEIAPHRARYRTPPCS